MGRLIYVNRTEAQILATALNNSKISYFSPSERAVIPKLARRLSGFMADGESESPNKPESSGAKPKKKPLIGFAKVRAEDEEWQQMNAELLASVDLNPVVVVADKLPPLAVSEREGAYAILRGERKLTS